MNRWCVLFTSEFEFWDVTCQ